MSRSNPTPTNPAKRFFKWSGSKGELSYYDKDKKEEIVIKLPFEFMVLDQLATITGFCEADSSSYWSNEVRNVTREWFTVRTSAGIKESGLYKELADVRSKGAKYAKSVYIAYKENEEYVIGNLKASGAALTSWIEFSNTVAVMHGKVTLTGSTEGKKGTTKYQIPTFEWKHTDTDQDEIAVDLDKELQVYLVQYLAGIKEETEDELEEKTILGIEEEKLKTAEEKRVKKTDKDIVIEDIGDEPINLDEIPF